MGTLDVSQIAIIALFIVLTFAVLALASIPVIPDWVSVSSGLAVIAGIVFLTNREV